MKPFEYIVMTPPDFRGSAGIRFLNQLTDDIRATGRAAHRIYSVTTDKGFLVSQNGKEYYLSSPEVIRQMAGSPERCIVIHGENQDCKNFEGMNAARYYLNKIGALKKTGIPREGEFKIAWDLMFCDTPHYVLRTCMLRYPLEAAAHIALDNRQIDLTYIGKGDIKIAGLTRIPHTLLLRRDWPDNDEEYFYLLKNTRRMYTYDAVTSVMDDAITLGAMPVLMIDDKAAIERAREFTYNCVAHVNDDMDEAMQRFISNRPAYLKAQQDFIDQYKRNLEECCVKMEQYFS